jgi:hypothetical protein
VQGGDPLAEDYLKARGLKDLVQPVIRPAVTGAGNVRAKKETQHVNSCEGSPPLTKLICLSLNTIGWRGVHWAAHLAKEQQTS